MNAERNWIHSRSFQWKYKTFTNQECHFMFMFKKKIFSHMENISISQFLRNDSGLKWIIIIYWCILLYITSCLMLDNVDFELLNYWRCSICSCIQNEIFILLYQMIHWFVGATTDRIKIQITQSSCIELSTSLQKSSGSSYEGNFHWLLWHSYRLIHSRLGKVML